MNKLIRIELNDKGDWFAARYAEKFDEFHNFEDNVDRIHANEIDCDTFIEKYEKPYKPVVIVGLQVNFNIK